MTEIKIKRVYDHPEKSDGFRVLVDKLWPRGVKKEDLLYDLWEKDITPSTELREWFHTDIDKNWAGFEKEYIKELENSEAMKEFINKIKREKTVTLLFASKDYKRNHALILQNYLEKKINK